MAVLCGDISDIISKKKGFFVNLGGKKNRLHIV